MLNNTQERMEALASELLNEYMQLGPLKSTLVRLNANSLDKINDWSSVPSTGSWLKFKQALSKSPSTFGLGIKINDDIVMGIVARIDSLNGLIEVHAIDFNVDATDIPTFVLSVNSILYMLDVVKAKYSANHILIKNEGCGVIIKQVCKSVGYVQVNGGLKK